MAIDGKWNIVIKTPMGDQTASVTLKQDGDALTGEMTSPNGAAPIEEGKVDGDNLSWKANVTNPMPLTLEFSGTLDGEALSGTVKLGAFGDSTFSGAPA